MSSKQLGFTPSRWNFEASLEAPASSICIPKDLTDLELFERFCLPIGDRWDDVSWAEPPKNKTTILNSKHL